MKAKDVLAELGGVLIGGLLLGASFFIGLLFLLGSVWVSTKLLPWFSVFTWIALGLIVFVFLPLAIPRATRGVSSVALLVSSYVFGVTLWMYALLLTLTIWGIVAVVIGLLIFGMGVVPIAMLATLLNGMWLRLVELVLLTVMIVATRAGSVFLIASYESYKSIPSAPSEWPYE